MAKLTVSQQKAKVAATIKINGNKEITPPKDKILRDDQLDSSPNWKDGGLSYESVVGYLTLLSLSDDRSFTHKKYVDDLVGSIDLSLYLPLSAGATKPLSDHLYVGGNDIRQLGDITDVVNGLSIAASNRTLHDGSGTLIAGWSLASLGFEIYNSAGKRQYIKTNATVDRTATHQDKDGIYAYLDDIVNWVSGDGLQLIGNEFSVDDTVFRADGRVKATDDFDMDGYGLDNVDHLYNEDVDGNYSEFVLGVALLGLYNYDSLTDKKIDITSSASDDAFTVAFYESGVPYRSLSFTDEGFRFATNSSGIAPFHKTDNTLNSYTIQWPDKVADSTQVPAMIEDLAPLGKEITADDSNNASASYKDIPGWSFNLEPNKSYSIDGILRMDNSAAAGGTNIMVTGPALSSVYITLDGTSTSNTTRITKFIAALNSASTAVNAWGTPNGYSKLDGTITTGANGGTFTVRYAPITNAQTTTVKRLGSFLSVKPII